MKYLCLIYDEEKTMARHVEGRGRRVHGRVFRLYRRHQEVAATTWAARRCKPVHTATTVRVRNGKMSTTDGPFAETKEQLGGYYLIEAKDLNEAHSGRGEDSVGARPAASKCGRSRYSGEGTVSPRRRHDATNTFQEICCAVAPLR